MLSLDEAKQVRGGYVQHIGHGVAEFYDNIPETYNGKNLIIVAKKYGQTLNSGFSIYLAYKNSVSYVDKGYGLEFAFKPIEKIVMYI